MAIKTEAQQRAMVAKFMMQGLTEKAATECVAVSVIYGAIFELTCHETNAAAILAAAVANSLSRDGH